MLMICFCSAISGALKTDEPGSFVVFRGVKLAWHEFLLDCSIWYEFFINLLSDEIDNLVQIPK